MDVRTMVVMTGVGVTVIGFGLMWANPSVGQYRRTILTNAAQQEAERVASAEQRAIEREAASLDAHLAGVHYEGSRLDRLAIQHQYPLLGALLIGADLEGSLRERLARVKEQALQRVSLTRETILYHTLADLTGHSHRTSYGLWSVYSTCHDTIRFAYLGIAGHFHERSAVSCPAPGRS